MSVAADVREAIEQVEEAYEFMLAYAAQGRQQEADTGGASQIRQFLERFNNALGTLSALTPRVFETNKPGAAFAAHFNNDVEVMQSIIELLLSRSAITSDMIDNTNGLIATRALLTDLFFIDQVVLVQAHD